MNEPNQPEMTMDSLSDVINNFIKDNDVKMLLECPEGTEEVSLQDNMGGMAMVQFYILLQGISTAGRQLYKDLGAQTDNWEMMVDALLGLLRKDLLECASQEGEEDDE